MVMGEWTVFGNPGAWHDAPSKFVTVIKGESRRQYQRISCSPPLPQSHNSRSIKLKIGVCSNFSGQNVAGEEHTFEKIKESYAKMWAKIEKELHQIIHDIHFKTNKWDIFGICYWETEHINKNYFVLQFVLCNTSSMALL